MLNATNSTEPSNAGADSVESLLVKDYELNGEINRASTQGAKFSLLLAMLEQNNLHRPILNDTHEIDNAALENAQAVELHHYRSSPLAADTDTWRNSQQTSSLVHAGHIQTAHLWLAMHPEPLSQHNNAFHLDEQIVANCSYFTQTRLKQSVDKTIEVNEAGLYDILQELGENAA